MSPDIRSVVHRTTLGPEYLAEIGRITVHFALLEWELIQLVHLLLSTNRNKTRIIVSQLSFQRLQDLSASLVKEVCGAEAAEEYREVLKLISKSVEERNAISHSMWGMSGGGTSDRVAIRTKFTARRSKGLRFQREELAVEDLHEIACDISTAIFELSAFRSGLGLGDPEWV